MKQAVRENRRGKVRVAEELLRDEPWHRSFWGRLHPGFGSLSSIRLGLCAGPIHDPVKDAG